MSLNGLTLNAEVMGEFNKIFASYGLDLVRYKPAFIKRRLDRRMRILDISEYSQYALVLKNDRKEFEEMFLSLSINVTNFFRDSTVFDRFQLSILPQILSGIGERRKIRVWSAGCASGEEPYSIAMLFKQVIGKMTNLDIEVVANDVNKMAIQFAERGRYPAKSVESLPLNIIENNFRKITDDQNNVEYEVVQSIKDMVTFKSGDILSDTIQSFDVVFCRNVLIYYEKEAQELILTKFYKGLRDSGYLVLGMDETLFGKRCQKLFDPLMTRERIYKKISQPNN